MRPLLVVAGASLLGAVVALLVAGWLWFHNLSVDIAAEDLGTAGPAGEVTCSIAPWDAAQNHNDDPPGGEHTPAYSKEVGSECYAANLDAYRTAVRLGVVGLVLAGVGFVSAARLKS